MNANQAHKTCVYIALAFAFVVIVLGAYTRLVDAGLGCPDWPRCYGYLVMPISDEEVQTANQKFKDSPFERAKAIPEVVHRFFAGTLGVLVLLNLIFAWLAKKRLTIPIVLLVLVLFQAILGAWTVTLKLWPQVVTAHLLGGFATLALLYLHALKEGYLAIGRTQLRSKLAPTIFGVLLICQITLGGWTSSNYAALACPDFPLCHGQLLPEMDFTEGFNFLQDIGPNYLGGNISSEARVAIQVTHRIGAIAVLIAGIWLLVLLPQGGRIHFGIFLGSQLTLGVLNVLLDLPLYIAVLHNLGAALLLLSTLHIYVSTRQNLAPSA